MEVNREVLESHGGFLKKGSKNAWKECSKYHQISSRMPQNAVAMEEDGVGIKKINIISKYI